LFSFLNEIKYPNKKLKPKVTHICKALDIYIEKLNDRKYFKRNTDNKSAVNTCIIKKEAFRTFNEPTLNVKKLWPKKPKPVAREKDKICE
jgi:hypothetical protein